MCGSCLVNPSFYRIFKKKFYLTKPLNLWQMHIFVRLTWKQQIVPYNMCSELRGAKMGVAQWNIRICDKFSVDRKSYLMSPPHSTGLDWLEEMVWCVCNVTVNQTYLFLFGMACCVGSVPINRTYPFISSMARCVGSVAGTDVDIYIFIFEQICFLSPGFVLEKKSGFHTLNKLAVFWSLWKLWKCSGSRWSQNNANFFQRRPCESRQTKMMCLCIF